MRIDSNEIKIGWPSAIVLGVMFFALCVVGIKSEMDDTKIVKRVAVLEQKEPVYVPKPPIPEYKRRRQDEDKEETDKEVQEWQGN